jgi:hypothetical protein
VQDLYEVAREIPTIFVAMEKETGYSVSSTVRDVLSFTAQCNTDRKYMNKYHRWQIPLTPAAATTCHKAQGITSKAGVVLLPCSTVPWARGLEYVGMSRATELNKFFLLRHLRQDHFSTSKEHNLRAFNQATLIRNEYKRLRKRHNNDVLL